MPDLSLPEIHFPDIKLPNGLRDMNRRDIQSAINDRMPTRIEMPEVDLTKVELPKAVQRRLDTIEKAIGDMDWPKAVEDRMPRRKRPNRFLPIAAIAAIGSLFAAAWWLITSPTAATRVRSTATRIRAGLSGQGTAIERYDDDANLGSLLPASTDEAEEAASAIEHEPWPDTFAELGETVTAGNGSHIGPRTGI